MQKPRANRVPLAVMLVALAFGGLGITPARAGEDLFEQAFGIDGEPNWLHYQAEYSDARGPHRIEIWRDHNIRVKRVTDDRIELIAKQNGEDIRFRVADLQRHRVTIVDRSNLIRIGLFADWFSQAHWIAKPAGAYALVLLGSSEQALGHRCLAWRLTQAPDGEPIDVCWSTELKIPLVVRDASQRVIWRVTALDRSPIADVAFAPVEHDAVHTDMNADFSPDAD